MRLSNQWRKPPFLSGVVLVAALAALPVNSAWAQQAPQQPQSQLSPAQQALVLSIDSSTQDALAIAGDARAMREKVQALVAEDSQHLQAQQSQIAALQNQNGELSRAKAWWEDCGKQRGCLQWLLEALPSQIGQADQK